MRLSAICLLMVSLVACGGDDGGSSPDAALWDAAPLPECTGAVYDLCEDTTDSSDCMDGLQCHYYDQAALTVCVPACSADNPCPDQGGAEIRCNNMGRCRPDVGNDCELP